MYFTSFYNCNSLEKKFRQLTVVIARTSVLDKLLNFWQTILSLVITVLYFCDEQHYRETYYRLPNFDNVRVRASVDRIITTLRSEVYRWEVFQNVLFSITDFDGTVKLSYESVMYSKETVWKYGFYWTWNTIL